jgi:hypothetical protein
VRQWISKRAKEADQQASESLLLALFTFFEKRIQGENWVFDAKASLTKSAPSEVNPERARIRSATPFVPSKTA